MKPLEFGLDMRYGSGGHGGHTYSEKDDFKGSGIKYIVSIKTHDKDFWNGM
jgi:hypothetical protein